MKALLEIWKPSLIAGLFLCAIPRLQAQTTFNELRECRKSVEKMANNDMVKAHEILDSCVLKARSIEPSDSALWHLASVFALSSQIYFLEKDYESAFSELDSSLLYLDKCLLLPSTRKTWIDELNVILNLAGIQTFDSKEYEISARSYLYGARFSEYSPDSNTNDYKFNAAVSFDHGKNYENAGEIYLELYEDKYKPERCAHYYAMTLKNQHRTDELIEQLTNFVQAHPKDLTLATDLVNYYIETNNYKNAIYHLSRIVERSPEDFKLVYTLGTLYMYDGNKTEAEKCLRKSVEIEPENTDALYQTGAHLFNWGLELNEEIKQMNEVEAQLKKETMILKFSGSAEYLEKYLDIVDDKKTASVLIQAYSYLGYTKKAQKARKKYY